MFKVNKEKAAELAKNIRSSVENSSSAASGKGGLADEDANLMIKLKFLTYKVNSNMSIPERMQNSLFIWTVVYICNNMGYIALFLSVRKFSLHACTWQHDIFTWRKFVVYFFLYIEPSLFVTCISILFVLFPSVRFFTDTKTSKLVVVTFSSQLRTFLIRNGLSILFKEGPAAYKAYYLR